MRTVCCLLLTLCLTVHSGFAADQIPITIEHPVPGAPITMGIPFPKGVLHSPEHVRLLTGQGQEIPSQITEVTTWAPADSSIKWIWVFFFADDGDTYQLEYGPDVRRRPITGDRITFVNNQRSGYGFAEITTGPLRFRVSKQASGGFLDTVLLDRDRDGFDATDTVATGTAGRSSILDLLDDTGIDRSRAVIKQTFKEKGSGPLHAILRVEGEYRYSRDDNNTAPFVTRIHAYAGKPYIRVLHTFTYTGVPDKHTPQEGQHAMIATSDGPIIDEEAATNDPGWTQPNDRIASAGLTLNYQLSGPLSYRTAYRTGSWWRPGERQTYETTVEGQNQISVLQTGPDPSRIPPVPNSTAEKRIDGFSASITAGDAEAVQAPQAEGWFDVTGEQQGVSVGIRNFMKEYPKELTLNVAGKQVQAYLWSPNVEPMSFARWSTEEDGSMVGNFAQGLTKTTELVFNFHRAETSASSIRQTMDSFLDPPVAHAPPQWYTGSKVYGLMAPHSDQFATYERGMDYKFQWWLFNQQWEPWYGMFDYGDGKNYYYGNEWYQYSNNEPAEDYMFWQQFMRTGSRDYYLAGEAMSRHTMDVDNTHWPTGPDYRGDTNPALDWWQAKDKPPGSPYLGMGRRHGNQQWTAMLSAHVWVPGWIASYYLSGYHRGLEVAKLTADYYRRRVFGKHGLTGRRLYLSVWNLTEVWDATKDERYRAELEDRVDRMLRLQREQGGNLVMDRYGYAQVYASRGLSKYLQLTGDPDVRAALIRHARWVHDNPPLNHEMESYLSSISSLLLGYKLTHNPDFYREALDRAEVLKTDQLPLSFEKASSQAELAEALESVSHLPPSRFRDRRRAIWSISNGIRVFGWTHAYNVPYLIYWLEKEGMPSTSSSR